LDRERGTKINRIVSRALSFLPLPLGRFVGVRVGVANFLSQSIDIDETNTFVIIFFVRTTVLGGLWALHILRENVRILTA